MHFIAEKDEIQPFLSLVNKAVPRSPSMEALTNVLINTYDRRIQIRGFDLFEQITANVEATIISEGSACVPARLLEKAVNTLHGEIEFKLTPTNFVVSCGESVFRLPIAEPALFPSLPEMEDFTKIKFPRAVISKSLNSIIDASSKDPHKQILTGVHLSVTNETFELAATDGHRLGVIKQAVNVSKDAYPDFELGVTVPANSLHHFFATKFDPEETSFTLSANATLVDFSSEKTSVGCQLLQGVYPAYAQLIPNSFEMTARVHVDKIIESLERVSAMAETKDSMVMLTLSDRSADIFLYHGDAGYAKDTIEIDYLGPQIDLSFNFRYLLDGFRSIGIGNEFANVLMNSNSSPVVLEAGNGIEKPKITWLVMPMLSRK